jgi:inner membrane protein
MPALIISANLPDIDSWIAKPLGMEPIAFHRGFTHGVGGLMLLPFLTAAMVIVWEKLQPSKSQPVRFWPLVLLCFLGSLSHSLLDLLNNYGIRLLDPFSNKQFYEDTLFIVDPWIWIMLILGLEFSWRAERLGRNWQRPAIWAFGAMLGYIGLNAAISLRAVAITRPLVQRVAQPQMIIASEVPLEFWKRRMVWRGEGVGGAGTYEPLKGLNHATLDPEITPLHLDDPRLAETAKRDRHVRAFLFWSRMPMVVERDGHAWLTDQRFYDNADRPGRRTFLIPLDNAPPSS